MSKNKKKKPSQKVTLRAAIDKAYSIGYSKGWNDAYNVPRTVGARAAAAFGYDRGVRNRRRSDTYVKRFNKAKA